MGRCGAECGRCVRGSRNPSSDEQFPDTSLFGPGETHERDLKTFAGSERRGVQASGTRPRFAHPISRTPWKVNNP